jgi:CRP/FNR family transcriptional regulator
MAALQTISLVPTAAARANVAAARSRRVLKTRQNEAALEPSSAAVAAFSIGHDAQDCASCSLHKLCLPTGLDEKDMGKLDKIIGRRRKVMRDARLYRQDDPFTKLYAVRVGHFKTFQVNPSGDQQITGFQMPGELLGMDAIGSNRHHCDAVALEDSEVCEIPFARLEKLLVEIPGLLRHFHRLMSQEIAREQNAMLLLGGMRAEQRLASFLVNIGARYAMRGYSPANFQLRMMREEIGNFLGLTIESISRMLGRFKKSGLLRVSNREIEVLDMPRLKALAAGTQ